MKTTLRPLVLVCLVAPLAAQSTGSPPSGELLVNGGFETGDLTGWSATPGLGFVVMTSGTPGCTQISPPTPFEGVYAFSSSASDGTPAFTPEVTIVQSVPLTPGGGYGATTVSASGWFAGAPGCGPSSDDTARIELDFFDVGGALLGTAATAALDPPPGAYSELALADVPLPAGTSRIDFRLRTVLDPGFASIDILSDALSLTLRSPLATDVAAISLAGGGAQQFALDAGAAHGGDLYVLLGSATGTGPTAVDGVLLPLTVDPYTLFALGGGKVLYTTPAGLLDALGQGSAAFALPAGSPAGLVGLRLYHAFLAFPLGGGADFASNHTIVDFVP